MPAAGPSPSSAPTVLHLAPHPDDELIGAPATLMALRDAGWRVVNQACGLGSDPARRTARAAELGEACRRARFELRLPPPVPTSGPEPFAPSPGYDGGLRTVPGGGTLEALIAAAVREERPAIVVSPDAADRHPAHAAVAAATHQVFAAPGGDAETSGSGPRRWWTYGIWGPLAAPTLATSFDATRLAEVLDALAAHAGELDRADYRRLVRGRAEAAAFTAPELLFGFGTADAPDPPGQTPPEYAELLRERILGDGAWRPGEPRWLDPAAPFSGRGSRVGGSRGWCDPRRR